MSTADANFSKSSTSKPSPHTSQESDTVQTEASNPSSSDPLQEQLQLDTAATSQPSTGTGWTWNGNLPIRTLSPSEYSRKVFLGGLPKGSTEESIMEAFRPFNPTAIDFPHKKAHFVQPKGWVFIILESANDVRSLLEVSSYNETSGIWYYTVRSSSHVDEQVAIIPWCIDDTSYMMSTTENTRDENTVVVTALNKRVTAEGLAIIMEDLFQGVVYAKINTNTLKYPKGSGLVQFNNFDSFKTAVTATVVSINTFKLKVAVVPWSLDEAVYAPITIPALPPEKTVYVKSLHKSLSARSLANIMEDVFENVIYAEISVDDLNYPTGSGIVTFGNLESYMKAVRTATININRYSWKIRIFPYMEDSPCSRCRKQQGPFFCSEFLCFRYFCNTCWHLHHNTIVQKHCALTKNSRERWTLGIPTLVS